MKNVGVFIYDSSLFGGAERVAINIANELANYTKVTIISCFNSKTKPAFQINENVNFQILSDKSKSLSFHCIELSKKLKNILEKNDIGVIINITAGVNTISYLATHNINTKVIYAEHSNLLNKTYGKKHEFRQWLGAKTADMVVTLTKSDKEQFVNKYNIQKKCISIYNWFEGSIENNYNVQSKKIITVGRLEAVKGYDRLIKVASKFFIKHPEWKWDIYGDGSLRDNIQNLIKDFHLENNVFLKGNNSDIIKLYKNYSFFVLTSYFEGLPLVLLEAKSKMLPIISFDCPTGPSEIITNGFDGFLIDNGNIDKMVDCMIEMVENDSIRKYFSNNSVNVLQKFDKAIIVSQWCKLIESL